MTSKNCKHCGSQFLAERKNRKIFCSHRCAYQFRRGKPIAHKPHLLAIIAIKSKPHKIKESRCLICGKPFQHYSGRKAKYCSRACWSERNPVVNMECRYCGLLFSAYVSSQRSYCSKRCDNLHRRILFKGSASHLWKGGRTQRSQIERGSARYVDWRNAVFARDGYRCQVCSVRSGNGQRIYLHAHHVKLFSEHLASRYEVSNGLTVCADCHRLMHTHKFGSVGRVTELIEPRLANVNPLLNDRANGDP